MNQKNQYLQNKKQIFICRYVNFECALVVFVRVRLSVCLLVLDLFYFCISSE